MPAAAVALGCGRSAVMARRSLTRLERAGLARRAGRGWAVPAAQVPGDPLTVAGERLLIELGNRPGRLLPVPRAALRHAAGGLTRGSLAALVACLVRCCWLRRGDGWDADFAGRVCGSRAAAAMGVSERAFRGGLGRLKAAGAAGPMPRLAGLGRRAVGPAAGRGTRRPTRAFCRPAPAKTARFLPPLI